MSCRSNDSGLSVRALSLDDGTFCVKWLSHARRTKKWEFSFLKLIETYWNILKPNEADHPETSERNENTKTSKRLLSLSAKYHSERTRAKEPRGILCQNKAVEGSMKTRHVCRLFSPKRQDDSRLYWHILTFFKSGSLHSNDFLVAHVLSLARYGMPHTWGVRRFAVGKLVGEDFRILPGFSNFACRVDRQVCNWRFAGTLPMWIQFSLATKVI